MSVAVGDYTNTDKIRGVLGFTVSDAQDEYIVSREIDDELLISLYEWIPDHATLFIAWKAGGSALDSQNIRQLKKYSTYQGAFILCSGIELLAVQAIGDSKATAERFSKVDLVALRRRLEGIASGVKSDLTITLGLSVISTTAALFAKVEPDFDPVTGS